MVVEPDAQESRIREAVVEQVLANRRYRLRCGDASVVEGHVAGRARMDLVRLVPGECVQIEGGGRDRGRVRIVGRGGL